MTSPRHRKTDSDAGKSTKTISTKTTTPKMTRLYLIILISLFASFSFAQKKEISAARDQLKSGKNLDAAENSMLKLLENPDNKNNVRIYRILNSAIQKQYEQLNEKIYLKQSVDSVAFFKTLQRAFNYAYLTDSIVPQERKNYQSFLQKYLPNLYAGGIYLFGKEKFADAYKLLDTYIESKEHPLFVDNATKLKSMNIAAYRALCCGYRLNDFEKTVKHKNLALSFKPGKIVAMKYLAETYLRTDSAYNDYVTILEAGFKDFPCEEYFYTHLIRHHMNEHEMEQSLNVANKAIYRCPDNHLYRYTKAHILLNMERYKDCIEAADSTIAISTEIADCYYIAGIANVYLAESLQDKAVKNKGVKQQMQTYYKNALPYFEEYRKREPNRKDKWGSPLYTIYLNLNKGKEFEEISKLLKKK